jgi:phosphoglycolate phosphatase
LNYKHIIWDWNGTLLNDVHQAITAVNVLLQRRNLPELTLERYFDIFDFPVVDFYRQIGFDFTAESYEAVSHEYIDQYVSHLAQCRLQEGAAELLQSLQQAGLSQSVLSAYHQQRLEEAVNLFHLRPYFVRLVGLNDYYAHSKVENGKRWIRQLECDKRDVLFIGDTFHDHEVAREMGVACVLLTCGHMPRRRLETLGVPLFDSLTQLRPWLLPNPNG